MHPELFAQIEAAIADLRARNDPDVPGNHERCDSCNESPCSLFDWEFHYGWESGVDSALAIVREVLGLPDAIEPRP